MKCPSPLLMLLLAAALPTGLVAQGDTLRHRQAVKINLVSPLLSAPSVSYEYAFSYHSALALDLAYITPRTSDVRGHAVAAQLQYRLYPFRGEMASLFFAYGVNYSHSWIHINRFLGNEGWDIHSERHTLNGNLLSPSGAIGFSLHTSLRFFLEASVGFILPIGGTTREISPTLVQNHLATLWTLRLGYAF